MSSGPNAPGQAPLAAIDNYFLDEDFDDPFASPSPKAGQDKRGAPEALGIDEEVQVKKRAREPRVKLDETRSVILSSSKSRRS
jgi:replication fork protection complex subunit Csm3/Swi3